MKTLRTAKVPRSVDGIVRRAPVFQAPQNRPASWRGFWSAILGAGSVLLIVINAVPLTAFEASVINVIARLEDKPCIEREVRSLGYWKTHQLEWVFPQTLGPDTVATPAEAVAVFSASGSSMRNRLKKQLLALKFNIASYGSGSGLVPGEAITLLDLAAEAEALLSEDPLAGNAALEAMKNRIEKTNVAGTVSTCPCPYEVAAHPAFGGASVGEAVVTQTEQVQTEPEESAGDSNLSLSATPAPSEPSEEPAPVTELPPADSADLNAGEAVPGDEVSLPEPDQEVSDPAAPEISEIPAPAPESVPEPEPIQPESLVSIEEPVAMPDPAVIPEAPSVPEESGPEEPSTSPAEPALAAAEAPLE